MEIRRVITGAIEGRGVFTADETVAAVSPPLVGNQIVRLWGFDKPPQTPAPGRPQDPKATFFPSPGAVRAVLWTAPPAAAVRHTAIGMAERQRTEEIAPGLALVEVDDQGLHTTTTSDLQLVLEGEIELVLESGERRTLRAGDVAVVNGIPHAWRNETSERCLVLAVFYGGRPREERS
jgi:mannose-6-phosphate isomerase-like protein (cupin superfamily)